MRIPHIRYLQGTAPCVRILYKCCRCDRALFLSRERLGNHCKGDVRGYARISTTGALVLIWFAHLYKLSCGYGNISIFLHFVGGLYKNNNLSDAADFVSSDASLVDPYCIKCSCPPNASTEGPRTAALDILSLSGCASNRVMHRTICRINPFR